jgi:hypothetical protein
MRPSGLADALDRHTCIPVAATTPHECGRRANSTVKLAVGTVVPSEPRQYRRAPGSTSIVRGFLCRLQLTFDTLARTWIDRGEGKINYRDRIGVV